MLVSDSHPPLRVPVRGYISAGYLEEAEDQPLGFVTVALPHTGGELFGLIVRGDSMADAGIWDGHVVLIRRQPTFQDGDIVVVAVDGQATLKRIYRHGSGYRLEPENASYPTLFVTRHAVQYDEAAPDRWTAASGERRAGAAPLDVRVLGLMVGLVSEAGFQPESPG